MSEYAKLPPNYNEVFNELMGPDELVEPSIDECIRDARDTAWDIAPALTNRMAELSTSPYGQTFYDVPQSEGSIRIAIAPPETMLDTLRGQKWRIVINVKLHVYKGGIPKEQWDIMDILVKPDGLRLAVKHARLLYVVGYGETGPPPGIPPRIVRDPSFRYSLSESEGYRIKLPDTPFEMGLERLQHYQNFTHTAGTALDVFSRLSKVTRVEAVPNLEQNGEL